MADHHFYNHATREAIEQASWTDLLWTIGIWVGFAGVLAFFAQALLTYAL